MKNAKDILREKGGETYSIVPDATVYSALKLMAEKDIGALLVFEGDKLVGLLSERDYARKVILKGRHSPETPVREIMTTPVITVDPQRNMEQCMELMTNHRVRHLPVVEGGLVIGIVSIGDIVKGIITHQEYIIEQLENYIKGWR